MSKSTYNESKLTNAVQEHNFIFLLHLLFWKRLLWELLWYFVLKKIFFFRTEMFKNTIHGGMWG